MLKAKEMPSAKVDDNERCSVLFSTVPGIVLFRIVDSGQSIGKYNSRTFGERRQKPQKWLLRFSRRRKAL